MKRVLTVFVAILMIAVLCCPAGFAADVPASHHLEELDVDIALPSWEEYYFLYPDMSADNPDLEYLGMTPEQVNSDLGSRGILLDVLHDDFSHEITVCVEEDSMYAEIYNYRELSAFEREIVLSVNTSLYTDSGVMPTVVEWLDKDNALWVMIEYALPNGYLCRQYSTVYNGKMLYVDAALYVADSGYESARDQVWAVVDKMVSDTVFCTTEATPDGVGGITGNVIGTAIDKAGVSTIDLTEAGLGILDLNEVDLSGLDLEGVVDALGMTEEEAIMLVKGEMAIDQVDLSKADPMALMDAIGMEEDQVIDLALSVLGFDGLDWRGILFSVGRGALIGTGAAVMVVILIIILLAVCGHKRRSAAKIELAAETLDVEEE